MVGNMVGVGGPTIRSGCLPITAYLFCRPTDTVKQGGILGHLIHYTCQGAGPDSAGILDQSMRARSRVGIGFS